jgi:hypothetical protein
LTAPSFSIEPVFGLHVTQMAEQVKVTTVPGAKIKQALIDYGGCNQQTLKPV